MRRSKLIVYLVFWVFLLVNVGCASPASNSSDNEIPEKIESQLTEKEETRPKEETKLTDDEIRMIIHKAEVEVHGIYEKIYLDKLAGIERPPFATLRPHLEGYFTEKSIIDNLQGFYDDEPVFMEWGYIMGEVFPFICYDMLDNMRILENQADEVLVNIIITQDQRAGFTMECNKALIKENGKWLVEYKGS